MATRWGWPALVLLLAALVHAWRRERGTTLRPIGISRLAPPPPPVPPGRVALSAAEVSSLITSLAQTRTVLLIGGVPHVSGRDVRRANVTEPERLPAVIRSLGDGCVVVVVAAPADEAEEWLQMEAQLSEDVLLYVLPPGK